MNRREYSVAIVESSQIVARGIASVISESELFEIRGIYSDVATFIESENSFMTDIVVVNPGLMTHQDRHNAIKHAAPRAKVVAMLYNYVDGDTMRQFDSAVEIYDKPADICSKLKQTVDEHSSESAGVDVDELSDREKEILIAVARGLINKEIASMHNISIHTVMTHRKNISRKTGIKSVSGLVVYALLNNLIKEHEVLM